MNQTNEAETATAVNQALKARDWPRASECLSRLVALRPRDAMAHYWLAFVQVHLGRLAEALPAAMRALECGLPADAAIDAQRWIAQDDFARGNRDAARGRLASLAPIYRDLLPGRSEALDFLRGATEAAICARDLALLSDIFQLVYRDTLPERLTRVALSPVVDLETWCEANGSPVVTIEQAQDVHIGASSPYSAAVSYRTEQVIFASIAGAEWIPAWAFVMAPDGAVLNGTSYQEIVAPFTACPHAYFGPLNEIVHYSPAGRIGVDEDVFWLGGPYDHHFGHWLIDFLPRLRGLGYCAADVRVAVPDTLSAKERELLAAAGLGPERLLPCRPDARYRFRRLHLVKPGTAMPPNPTSVRHVREWLCRPAETCDGPRKLFIARTTIATRRVVNEAELQTLLREQGFSTVDMTEMSIGEQQELLARAEIVMGVYGSNLFAIYFAPPGCNVIALMPPDYDDPTILHTAALFGMKHQFFWCAPAADQSGAIKTQKKDLDIVVDCAALRQRLAELAP